MWFLQTAATKTLLGVLPHLVLLRYRFLFKLSTASRCRKINRIIVRLSYEVKPSCLLYFGKWCNVNDWRHVKQHVGTNCESILLVALVHHSCVILILIMLKFDINSLLSSAVDVHPTGRALLFNPAVFFSRDPIQPSYSAYHECAGLLDYRMF